MKGTEEHRVAVVTGAGSGVGAAVAQRFAEDGYDVVGVGRRAGPLEAVAERLAGRMLPCAVDAATEDGAAAVVATAVDRFGGIDAIVLSAGSNATAAVAEDSLAGWNEVLRVNLTGVFLLSRAALPHLIARGGSIVTIASANAWQAGGEAASYNSSKAAAVMLTRSLAVDYGPRGVRANSVCPGWVRTAMADADMDAIAEGWGIDREGAYRLCTAANPLRRPAEPADVAAVVAFLAGPDARYVNGAAIPVDGGAGIVDDSYMPSQGRAALDATLRAPG